MAVSRTRVTGPVMLPDGSPAPDGAKVIFTLRTWDKQAGALITRGPKEAPVVGGAIDITLERTAAGDRQALYDVAYTYFNVASRQWVSETLGSVNLAGAGPLNLADLLVLPAPVPNVPDALVQAAGFAASAGVDAERAEGALEATLSSEGRAAVSAAQAALYDGPRLMSVQQLLMDTALTYAPGTASSVVSGDIIRVDLGGFSYTVAVASSTDAHLETQGGVKLYVNPDASGRHNFLALGAPLHKACDVRGSPFPGRIHPTVSVTGMPSAV